MPIQSIRSNKKTSRPLPSSPLRPGSSASCSTPLVIIVLGLIYVSRDVAQTIALNVTYAETLGAQLENEQLAGSSFDSQDIQDPALAMDVNPADDPLARPPDLQPRPDGYLATDKLPTVSVGLALSGREVGMKRALLAKYGGTALTERGGPTRTRMAQTKPTSGWHLESDRSLRQRQPQ